MKKAEITLRLTFSSKKEDMEHDLKEIKQIIPSGFKYFHAIGEKGRKDYGDNQGIRPFPATSFFAYEYEFRTLSIEDCNKFFISKWSTKTEVIHILRNDYGFFPRLSFEILPTQDFPIFRFDRHMLAFLGQIQAELNFEIDPISK